MFSLQSRTNKQHVFPFREEYRSKISRSVGLGWPCRSLTEHYAHFEDEWALIKQRRLPVCAHALFCQNLVILVQNVWTVLKVYLLGWWDDDSMQKFDLTNYLQDSGVKYVERVREVRGASETLSTVLYRLWTCNVRDHGEVVESCDGDAFRTTTSAMLTAKLLPRATLCLIFPYGSFITVFVSLTAPYPLWCTASQHLNERLPRLLVFDSHILAEERVLQMGHYAKWKVSLISVYIFINESRIFRYLYGVLEFLMILSTLFFPSKLFLGACAILIPVQGLAWSLYIVVLVGNLMGIQDDIEEDVQVSTAEAGTPAASYRDSDVEQGGVLAVSNDIPWRVLAMHKEESDDKPDPGDDDDQYKKESEDMPTAVAIEMTGSMRERARDDAVPMASAVACTTQITLTEDTKEEEEEGQEYN